MRTVELTGITNAGHTVIYRIAKGAGITSSHSPDCPCLTPGLPARLRRRRRPTT